MVIVEKSEKREVRKLYKRGLSKSKVSEFTGLTMSQVNEALRTARSSTFVKHEQNKRQMAEQIRLQKLGLIGFKVPRAIEIVAKQVAVVDEVKKIEESSSLRTYQKRNEIRNLQLNYGRRVMEKVANQLNKAYERNIGKGKRIKRRNKFAIESIDVDNVIEQPRYEYPEEYEESSSYIPEEPSKKGFHIIVSGLLMTKGRKYSLVDINFFTNEEVSVDEIFAYVNSHGYNLQRTRRMAEANEDRVNVLVVKGNEYVYHNTEMTNDWKSSMDKAMTGYNFRNPHSGAYWRKVKKLSGKSVSNPDYQKMFDERGVL